MSKKKDRENQNREIEGTDLDMGITLEEVNRAVIILKTEKAIGIDLIPNEMLKRMEVITILRVYFDKYFDFGKHPTMWSKAVIAPIPKSSDKNLIFLFRIEV